MLTPERWRQVEALFDEAVLLPVAGRAAFLASRCQGDAELRSEVASLLAAEAASDAGAALIRGAASDWASGEDDAIVGRNIDGYRVLSLLGAGGMGEVYVARELSLRRQVALKLLPVEFNANDRRVQLFADEALAASALNHPNIVTVYRIGAFEGRQYIATELVDGHTLRERIARGPIAVDEAVRVAVQIAGALGQAHDGGIVHRDIKPENVVIRFDGLAKVIDFGLAKLEAADGTTQAAPASRAKSRAGTVVGTIDYMAPEQAAGGRVDHRADLYSLSVVLHEMVTGMLPRGSAIAVDRPSGPDAQALPHRLKQVIRRGLETDPDRRYQSAAALRADLLTLGQTQRDPAARRPWRYAAAAAAAVLIAAAALWWRGLPVPPATVRSLVVMPLQSMDGAAGQSHLERGLTDAILTRLNTITELRVAPAAAVKPGEDPFDAARRLSSDAVLTGSVRRLGDQLRVSVQIARARDRTQIWAGRFDERFSEIFLLEDTIAERVVAELLATVTPQQRAAMTRRDTHSADAYDLYLRARAEWSRRTGASIRTAVRMFEDAIKLDPNFALAYAGLADCYNLTASGLPSAERYPRARAAAEKALALNPKLGAAHTAMAFTLYKFTWNMREAERAFQRAVDLDPQYALAHHWFGEFLKLLGRHDESMREFRLAVALDPFSIPVRYDFILSLLDAGRVGDARALLDESVGLDPNAVRMVRAAADVLFAEGRISEAVEMRLREYRIFGVPEREVSELDADYRSGGVRAMHLRRARQLEDQLPNAPASPTPGLLTSLAQTYAELRDRERTVQWMTRAADAGEDAPLLLKTRAFAFIADDPRLQALVLRVFG